ncbi:MAG: sortase [Eubacteriales bacterium]|nr:sortase [Eubacteriales bacterium]
MYNRNQDAQAGKQAEELVLQMHDIIHEQTRSAESRRDVCNPTEQLPSDLPVKEIEGYDYIGYLTLPSLDLELPVMSEWDYTRLELAPCRQFGSSRTDDLVIAAHNGPNHFGLLFQLTPGDRIYFTDFDGLKNRYEVVNQMALAPTEVAAVQNSGYDLVLYTCSYSAQNRVTVFCNRLQFSEK